jgi:hypothetical protein
MTPPKTRPSLTEQEKVKLFKEGRSKYSGYRRLDEHKKSGTVSIGGRPLTVAFQEAERASCAEADKLNIVEIIKWVDPQTETWMVTTKMLVTETHPLRPVESKTKPKAKAKAKAVKEKIAKAVEGTTKKPAEKSTKKARVECRPAIREIFQSNQQEEYRMSDIRAELAVKGIGTSESGVSLALLELVKEEFLVRQKKIGKDVQGREQKIYFYQLKTE